MAFGPLDSPQGGAMAFGPLDSPTAVMRGDAITGFNAAFFNFYFILSTLKRLFIPFIHCNYSHNVFVACFVQVVPMFFFFNLRQII